VVPPTEPCALRSTQPLKVSTRDLSWSKGGRCVRLTTYHPCSAETSRKSGALIYPVPLGSPRPVAGHLFNSGSSPSSKDMKNTRCVLQEDAYHEQQAISPGIHGSRSVSHKHETSQILFLFCSSMSRSNIKNDCCSQPKNVVNSHVLQHDNKNNSTGTITYVFQSVSTLYRPSFVGIMLDIFFTNTKQFKLTVRNTFRI